MASIGDIPCTFVRPLDYQSLAPRIEVWVVPGVAGVGSRDLGRNDSAFAFEAVAYGTPEAMLAWFDSLRALQGSVVSIVDDYGTVYATCLVVRVVPPSGRGDPRQTRMNNDGLGTCEGRAAVAGMFLPAPLPD